MAQANINEAVNNFREYVKEVGAAGVFEKAKAGEAALKAAANLFDDMADYITALEARISALEGVNK